MFISPQLRLSSSDEKRLVNLAKKENVEWGGTLTINNGVLKIKSIKKGGKYGLNLTPKKDDILFHTHPLSIVKENCGNDFPSSADIDMIIFDKINLNIKLHVLVTPSYTFYIFSKRDRPLSNEMLNNLEKSVCSKKISVRGYINILKEKNIIVLYSKNE